MHLSIVSMTEKVFEGETSSVSVPTSNGIITLLDHHEAIVAMIVAGEIHIHTEEGEKLLFTGGGFLHVENSMMTILADKAEDLSKITQQEAEDARSRAEEQVSTAVGVDALLYAKAELERSLARLKLLRKKHHPHTRDMKIETST